MHEKCKKLDSLSAIVVTNIIIVFLMGSGEGEVTPLEVVGGSNTL